MPGQSHGHGFGEEGRHRDAFGLHLLVKRIELVGGDRVSNAEAGHRQARFHIAVHGRLKGVEGHGVARSPETVDSRSRR